MEEASYIIIYTVAAWIIAEIAKVIISSYRVKKIDIAACIRYGGMPSSHSAFVVGLATSVYIAQGLSALFVVCCALAILVIRDITVIRSTIDELIRAIGTKAKHIRTITHSYHEILVGILIGIGIPFLLAYVL